MNQTLQIGQTVDDPAKQGKELTDSIKYASYIQSALLPAPDLFQRLLKEYFIFFLPKDFVSGDFYWIGRHRNEIIVVAADCTGHGVPGAFMSILGISFLNEILGKGCFSSAAGILNQLRERVMKSLHQTGERNEQKDGMDIALCMFNPDTGALEYAGANNPFYLVRQGTLIEIRGDRMPIGINIVEEKSFTNHTLQLEENDMVYLITDGYPDQFGGPDEKKFKYKPFKELLEKISKKPMKDQKQLLENEMHQWMQNLKQVDDILVVGFKYIRSKSVS